MTKTTRPWGQHLVLDMSGCSRSSLKDSTHLRQWIAELVTAIGMKAYGEPMIEHFATHSHDSAGYTLVQLIETSNICAHFAENLGEAYIDVFSCREFDVNVAEGICRSYFEPTDVIATSISRGTFMRPLLVAS